MKFQTLKDSCFYIQNMDLSTLKGCLFIISKDADSRKRAYSTLAKRLLEQGYCTKSYTKELPQETLFSLSLFEDKTLWQVDLADRLKTQDAALISRIMSENSPHCLYAICLSELPKQIADYTKFPSFEMAELKPWEQQKELSSWIDYLCQSAHKKIEYQAKEALIKDSDLNRSTLENELEKLILATFEKETITLSDVLEQSSGDVKGSLFLLADHIFENRQDLALHVLIATQEDGSHPLQITRYLRGQILNLVLMKSLMLAKKSDEDIASHFPQMRPKSLEKNLQYCSKLRQKGLESALLMVDRLEIALKNEKIDEQLSMEQLIVKLCSTCSQMS